MADSGGSEVRGCLKAVALVAAVALGLGVIVVVGLAMTLGKAFDAFDQIGQTGCEESELPMVVAAATGDVDAVREELDDGADPDEADADGNTALACAGPRGHVATVALLLDRGASPTTYARDGDTVLADAVRFCQPKVAELLLGAGADPGRSGKAISLLDQAARTGDREMVEVLLAGKVDPSSFQGVAGAKQYGVESTSDCRAPTDEGLAGSLTVLLGAGADPSAVLGTAAALPAPVGAPILEASLAKGADPDSEAAGPVLAVAVAGGDRDVAALMLAAGADPNRGPTEEDAEEPGSTEPEEPSTTTTLPPFELFSTDLCDGPIDPTRCDVALALRQFTSFTTYGVEASDATAGPERSARDRATAPPLMVAAWGGDAELVQMLLDAGADPRAVTPDGYGPLHAAAAGGDAEIVQRILASGAATASPGESVAPSVIATNAHRDDLAAVLQAAGR